MMKIYNILNKNTVEIVKIHFFNKFKINKLDDFINNKYLDEFINEKNILIDYNKINDLLIEKYCIKDNNNNKLIIKKGNEQKELTCEYIECKDFIFIN